ncbi:MAG: RNA polymerase sigma factor [Mangrovibacterium sp.]
MEDLSQLIKDCAAGRTRAQARLYQLFAPRMYGVCLRYSRNVAEAEDNLQDGFIKVFDKIRTFRREGSFEGWVRRIMVNVSLEKFRKQNLLHPVDDLTAFEMPEPSVDVLSGIAADDLMKLIRELSPRYRMVFNLYVFEGMSHREIARELKISEGTSKSNLSRARMILKKQILLYYKHNEPNFSA